MPEFVHKERGVRFEVAESPTVEQHLTYFGTMALAHGDKILLNQWRAAKLMITKWECDFFPDHTVGLDEVTDRRVAEIVIWAGGEVLDYMQDLDKLDKKSSSSGGK